MNLQEFVKDNQQSLIYGFAAEQHKWNLHAAEYGTNWRQSHTFESYCTSVFEQYQKLINDTV